MKYRVGEGHDGAMAVEARLSAIANSVHNIEMMRWEIG